MRNIIDKFVIMIDNGKEDYIAKSSNRPNLIVVSSSGYNILKFYKIDLGMKIAKNETFKNFDFVLGELNE